MSEVMLRINACTSADGAKRYYTESHYIEGKHTRLDYYAEKDKAIGIWGGTAAGKLGLSDGIRKQDFDAVCDNKRPDNDEALTGRTNLNRRVGYDFTFNASKSISLAYAFGDKEQKREISNAFQDSVRETMSQIEKEMLTRVRAKGENYDRLTGNMLWGEFTHYTTRPVKNIPDPHLHIHCFVPNATYCKKEKKWKAGQFGQIKQDGAYYQAYFHSALAKNLQEAGYNIRRTKNGIEIKEVSDDLIKKFSNRTKQIEEHAEKFKITDIKAKSKIGENTRARKQGAISEREQLIEWKKRLSIQEQQIFKNLKTDNTDVLKPTNSKIIKQHIDYAINHHLERKSVVSDKEVLAMAIKQSSCVASPQEIIAGFNKHGNIISVKDGDRNLVTTKEALKEEKKLIANANSFRGSIKPINTEYKIQNEKLNEQQKRAVQHALNTKDGLIIISGKAGVGKTTLMREVKAGIQLSGKKIFSFAPSANASRNVQRSEGFADADTVASLIQNKERQSQFRKQIIWIDEAGQLSNKAMNRIFDIAKEQNARIILSGDTRQHNSIERGDALRIIQKYSAVKSIYINNIIRQKNKEYRNAVKLLSKGNIEKGFDKLIESDSLHEIEKANDRVKAVAIDYINSSGWGKQRDVLVVSPTHKEGLRVTKEIRHQLKQKELLGKEDREFNTLRKLPFTEVEKKDIDNYQVGQVLTFHQHAKGVKAGSKLTVHEIYNGNIIAKNKDDILIEIPLKNTKRYSIYERQKNYFTKGDKLRITNNGKSINGGNIYNGSTYYVNGFDKLGNIKLSNGALLSKNYGHFTQGYVTTSHSSQGKTADKVIISQSSQSFKASSLEQFYVSVSRGKNAVSIYTDNKQNLLNAVKQSTHRLSGMELIGGGKYITQIINNYRQLKNKIGASIDNRISKIRTHEIPRQNITRPGRTR